MPHPKCGMIHTLGFQTLTTLGPDLKSPPQTSGFGLQGPTHGIKMDHQVVFFFGSFNPNHHENNNKKGLSKTYNYQVIQSVNFLFGMVSENVTFSRVKLSDLQGSGIKFGHELNHLVGGGGFHFFSPKTRPLGIWLVHFDGRIFCRWGNNHQQMSDSPGTTHVEPWWVQSRHDFFVGGRKDEKMSAGSVILPKSLVVLEDTGTAQNLKLGMVNGKLL